MIKEHFYYFDPATTPAVDPATTPAVDPATTPAATDPSTTPAVDPATTPAATDPSTDPAVDPASASLIELKKKYEVDTEKNIKLYRHLHAIRVTKGQNTEQLRKNNNNINDRTDERETNKRLVEIRLNKDRKTNYILNVLKISIIIIGCLEVIPILVKLKILKKIIGLGIFAVSLLVIVCVILYFSYFKNYNRDANNFSKFNFKNPDSKEIARSKINVDLSEADQARCQAFSEVKANFNKDTIQLNMNEYLTKTDPVDDSCPSA